MPKDLHTLDLTWPFWGALALVVAWSFTREDRRERVLDGLASYRLSVASLGGLFLISWLGTVAQVDVGLFRAQKIYFESWFFTERVGLFGDWRLALPLPGGQLLMSLLAVNLLVGGLVRVGQRYAKARGTRRGILLSLLATHLGVVVLLAAGIVKLHASDNGHVTLYEGESTSEFVSFHEWEVAIHDASQKEQVEEWIVPQEDFLDLERGSRRFETAELPFDLVLEQFAPNARVLPQGDHPGVAVGAVDGWALVPQEMENQHERNFAGILARIQPRQAGSTSSAILSGWSRFPHTFEVDGRTWAISLRRRRFDLPGEIELVDFHRELHPRTGMASVFRSDVLWREDDGAGGRSEDAIRIAMNEPLRRDGLALFQANWGPQDDPDAARLYSQLEVTRNPSDHWPTAAVIVIGVAMTLALALKFRQWLRQQAARAARAS
jgi:hypothetical protein